LAKIEGQFQKIFKTRYCTDSQSLNQIAFGSVAILAKQFNVAGGVAPALCDGDNMIVFQIFPAAAFHALSAVSAPNFPADCGPNCVPAFVGIFWHFFGWHQHL
jgi:hypothetical protein